ncbi:MAG: thiamine pyrophosphate-dependent enzyme [Pseudomonadota bacterium]
MSKTAAKVLLDTLVMHGIDRAFCVPGESYLAVMSELHDDPVLHLVTCRHEGGAAFMALADGKLTDQVGVVFASRGPGATNAAIAAHSAEQGAQPMLLLLGQVSTGRLGRNATQEMDFTKTFGDIAKSIEEVHDPDRIGEVIARAISIAESGTPGPVVVGLPTNVLETMTDARPLGRHGAAAVHASDSNVAAVADMLAEAERPIIIAGGRAHQPAARQALRNASEAWGVPVFATFEHQDVFDHEHPNFAGELGIRPPAPWQEVARAADLVLAVGTRLGDMATLNGAIPGPEQRLVHVYPDATQIGRNQPVDTGVVSEAQPFLEALAARNAPPPSEARKDWIAKAHGAYEETSRLEPRDAPDGMDFGHMILAMQEHLPDDSILTSDAGSFASWMHRHYRFKSTQTLLGSEAGAMGMGVPAAVAAAIRHPDRQVVALVGDGGAMMTGAELATAVKENAKIRVIISNNNNYGTIRFHQETHFPGRTHATDLVNPDFAAWARSFGASGFTVSTPEEAGPVLREALAADGPAVIDVLTSLENVDSANTIQDLRNR